MKRLCLISLALVASACEPLPLAGSPGTGEAAQGLALASSHCARCHAIARYGTPPNPDAPNFAAIANQSGLTGSTLASWLRDAHNYPGEMQFELEDHQVDELVAYILTLRDPNYRPSPS